MAHSKKTKTKKAPNGSHIMPNGKVMKNSAMKKGQKKSPAVKRAGSRYA